MEKRRVLLVEDNPDDRFLALHALQQTPFPLYVVTAEDGAEALDYLLHRNVGEGDDHQNPDLILLDLKLPRVDGFQVLRTLRTTPATQLIPVVVLTTSEEPADVIESYRSGCNSYIRKPVDFQQFEQCVKTLAQYWLALNEPPTPSLL